VLHATVSAAGELYPGGDAIAAQKNSTGVYTVTFAQDLTSCSGSFAPGFTSPTPPGDHSAVGDSSASLNIRPTNVEVRVFNNQSQNVDTSFHVLIAC
jgi:hypothetical protein